MTDLSAPAELIRPLPAAATAAAGAIPFAMPPPCVRRGSPVPPTPRRDDDEH